MPTVLPRHVLCVLGDWGALEPVAETVLRAGGPGFSVDLTFSQLAPDARMPRAFQASWDRVAPSFTAADGAAVEAHRAVAYVLSPPLPEARALELSARALEVVAALLASGGVAAKCDSSGIAHGRARWLALAEEARGTPSARAVALHAAFVRRPIEDEEGYFYSCGMHLLGQRDVEVTAELAPLEAVEWLDDVAYRLLSSDGPRTLRAGGTFAPRANDPRRPLSLTACTRYPEDDFLHNPYGYWRVGRPPPH